ncbi:MAG: DUF2917 domain-containing protein [Candidatus Accumulibacter sp.]|uniref:DUF2917 domain-containing protein n=1 Tax=Accumulibacter sp. TaxID=2053492 RepID=UPI001A63A4FF|nr:DUF2917 domain-containing protein [Accumulibacter sp.]MBL8393156.1 DUF2917 domain-containing protein [Accumulibacter sp.]
MNLDLCNNELCLADNTPVRLLSARGVRVTCTAGLAWLTVEGEAGDIFLKPGDSHQVGADGLALLEAIGSARVRFERSAADRSLVALASLQQYLSRLHGLARCAWRVLLPAGRTALNISRS